MHTLHSHTKRAAQAWKISTDRQHQKLENRSLNKRCGNGVVDAINMSQQLLPQWSLGKIYSERIPNICSRFRPNGLNIGMQPCLDKLLRSIVKFTNSICTFAKVSDALCKSELENYNMLEHFLNSRLIARSRSHFSNSRLAQHLSSPVTFSDCCLCSVWP